MFVLVDEFTGLIAVYPTKNKGDAPILMARFIDEFGTPEEVRSDNAPELVKGNMAALLEQCGIEAESTVPGSPQQNGLVEREIATINALITTVLIEAKMPNTMWPYAARYVAYTRNRSLRARTGNKTAIELFYGVPPDMTLLRTFGCVAYVHTPAGQRRKLEPRAWKGVMVGYAAKQKGWIIMDPRTGHIFARRNVTFSEKQHGGDLLRNLNDRHAEPIISPSLDDSPPPLLDEEDEDAPETSTPQEESQTQETSSEVDDHSSQTHEERTPSRFPNRQRGPPGNWWMTAAVEAARDQQEPRSYREATTGKHRAKWQAAMEEELASLETRGTWRVVPKPHDVRLVGCKWVYKLKTAADGSIQRYKARLVAQGYTQREGDDYNEVYAPVTTSKTLRVLLAVAAAKGLRLRHIDIKSAYLHADIDEDIYMALPEGYPNSTLPEDKCLKILKSLYGLKQAGHNWHRYLDTTIKAMGLRAIESDECLYVSSTKAGNYFVALVYVDDVIVAYQNEHDYTKFAKALNKSVEVGTEEELSWYIGIKIENLPHCIRISQEKHIKDALKQFNMEDCKPAKTPALIERLTLDDCPVMESPEQAAMKRVPYRQLVGKLVYIATCSRPDIAYAVSELGRFLENPGQKHWKAAKHVVRYLKGTMNAGINFYKHKKLTLETHCDADFAGDTDTRRSTSGFLCTLAGGAVSWKSHRQSMVTLSSTEAELVSAVSAGKEVIHLRRMLKELGAEQIQATKMFEDNQSCIALALSDRRKQRTKHIDVPRHYLKELVDNHQLKLQWKASEDMLADILTKPLGPIKFMKHQQVIVPLKEECQEYAECSVSAPNIVMQTCAAGTTHDVIP
jgi:hypothetical protein